MLIFLTIDSKPNLFLIRELLERRKMVLLGKVEFCGTAFFGFFSSESYQLL